MKLIRHIFFVAALLALNASAQVAPPQPPTLRPPPSLAPGQTRMPPGMMHPQSGTPPVMPDKEKLSYAIGFNIANNIKKDEFEVDVDAIAAAMKDVLAGRPTRFDEKEVKEIMLQFQQAMRAEVMARREKQMAENKVKGEEYLAKNAKAPGVTILTNGIQYKVIKEGSGAMPKTNDMVTVAYKGSLIDGTVFDQNEHFTTAVTGRTIKGWSVILPLMKIGSKWEVTIPTELGYGVRGFAPKIGPNAVLVFEMELVSIGGPAPTAPANRPPLPPSALAPHPGPPAPPGTTTTTSVNSSQILKVPSAEEIKKGAKIEIITNAPQ